MFKLFKSKVNIPQLAKAVVIKSKKININGWTYGINYLVQEDFSVNKDIKINISASEKEENNVFSYMNYFHLIISVKVKDIEVAVYQMDNQLKNDWATSWVNGLDFNLDKTSKNIIHELTDEWITNINEWSNQICKEYDAQIEINKTEKQNKYLKENKHLYN